MFVFNFTFIMYVLILLVLLKVPTKIVTMTETVLYVIIVKRMKCNQYISQVDFKQ